MSNRSRPTPPRPLLAASGKLVIMPQIDVIRVNRLAPRFVEEHIAADKGGRLVQIVYSRSMYKVAIARADELVAKGHPEHRIEFVLAERDEKDAVFRCEFDIITLDDYNAIVGA